MVSRWGGRKVRPLVNLTLLTKGTICHLCGLPGADSADHDPPRRELIEAGVPDPDSIVYLWPSHRRPCNVTRQDKPVTEDLRTMLRARRLAYLGTPQLAASLSPRFAHLFDRPSRQEADRKSVV